MGKIIEIEIFTIRKRLNIQENKKYYRRDYYNQKNFVIQIKVESL
jgi:hypothetical protein